MKISCGVRRSPLLRLSLTCCFTVGEDKTYAGSAEGTQVVTDLTAPSIKSCEYILVLILIAFLEGALI